VAYSYTAARFFVLGIEERKKGKYSNADVIE